MKKILAAGLLAILTATAAHGQATARIEALTMDTRQSRNLTVSHKAYAAIQFSCTVTDSVAGAAVNITGKTGTMGFKGSRSDTNFWAEQSIVITDGAAGQFTATFTTANWATNITVKKRYYGDVQLSNFGAPLPSIDLWLYPTANQGTEATYVSPTIAGFETNLTLVTPLNRVNFGSGLDATYETVGTTSRLTLVATGTGLTSFVSVSGDLLTAGTNGQTTTIGLTTGTLDNAGVAMDADLPADWWTIQPTNTIDITTNAHPGAVNERVLASDDGDNFYWVAQSGGGGSGNPVDSRAVTNDIDMATNGILDAGVVFLLGDGTSSTNAAVYWDADNDRMVFRRIEPGSTNINYLNF